MADSDKRGKDPLNYVHVNAQWNERVKKELKNQQLYTNFTINPFTPMYTVTGKPNSLHDAELDQGEEDELMKKVIGLAQKPPTEKYTDPQTSSQEYGWITQPLLKQDRGDKRLWHPKHTTEVTCYKEAEWRLKEQTQNMN